MPSFKRGGFDLYDILEQITYFDDCTALYVAHLLWCILIFLLIEFMFLTIAHKSTSNGKCESGNRDPSNKKNTQNVSISLIA